MSQTVTSPAQTVAVQAPATSAELPPTQQTSALSLIIICVLVGLNLRPALAAIGPVVTLLQQDTGLSFSGVAWLTLLPVLAMGIGCFVTLWLRRHISLAHLIQGALALLLLANLLRLIDASSLNAALLLLTSLLAGSGIAVIQATLPIVVKSLASDSARIMGFYVSAIMGGGGISGWPYSFSGTVAGQLARCSGLLGGTGGCRVSGMDALDSTDTNSASGNISGKSARTRG